MATPKEQVIALIKLYWDTDNERLQDLIVRSIYVTLKQEIENEQTTIEEEF